MKLTKKISKWITMYLLITMMCGLMPSNVLAYAGGSYYEKPAFKAAHLYVIDMSDMEPAERTMIAALQGIVSNKTSNQIYITDTQNVTPSGFGSQGYTLWLNEMKAKQGVTTEEVSDPWALVDTFKSYIKGYILYEKNTDSMNVASSLAGVVEAIPVDSSYVNTAQQHGLVEVQNVVGKNESWLVDNYWSELNHGVAIESREDDNHALHLRGYAAMAKVVVFYDGNSSFRSQLMGMLDDDSVVMGWGDTSGGSEEAFIANSSSNGVQTQPADWAMNLPVLSGMPAGTYQQNTVAAQAEDNVHYVCFYVSDGDNIQWALNRGNKVDWWGSSSRGNFPLGWTIAPSLLDLAPTVMDYHYGTATNKDNFIVGPSGNGFIFPAAYPENELELHTSRLNDYMGALDLGVVGVIGRYSLDNTSVWDKYTSQPNVDGLFYYEWSPYFGSPHNGKIVWSNNKPVISTSYKLADGLSYAPNKDAVLNGINSSPTDPSNASGYSLVCVDAWNNYELPATLDYIVNNLDSDVRVVTPDEFVRLITENLLEVPDKSNIALNKTATANQNVYNEEPYMAVDGYNTTKWCSTEQGDKWLKVDLGQTYTITRWVVKHAGEGGETVDFNTKDFKLQKSDDGVTWTDVDTVTGNSANVTDRTVSAFDARYIRLYITNPTQTSDPAARIYELQLFE